MGFRDRLDIYDPYLIKNTPSQKEYDKEKWAVVNAKTMRTISVFLSKRSAEKYAKTLDISAEVIEYHSCAKIYSRKSMTVKVNRRRCAK